MLKNNNLNLEVIFLYKILNIYILQKKKNEEEDECPWIKNLEGNFPEFNLPNLKTFEYVTKNYDFRGSNMNSMLNFIKNSSKTLEKVKINLYGNNTGSSIPDKEMANIFY